MLLDMFMPALKTIGGAFPQMEIGKSQSLLAKMLPQSVGAGVPRTTADVLKLYGDSPLLRMVAGRISSDSAAQTWAMFVPRVQSKTNNRHARKIASMSNGRRHKEIERFTKAQDLIEMEEHPILTMLRGNDIMLGSVFRRLTQLHIDLVGEAFWMLTPNAAGVPDRALIVPPSWVTSTPNQENGQVFEVSIQQFVMEVPHDKMIWFLDPNPAAPYSRGLGTGATLGDELEVEEFTAKHVKRFFLNSARPEILIAGPNLGVESAKALEQRWLSKLQGFNNRYLPFFMNAPDGMSLHEMSQDFESMQLTELRKHQRDIVMQTFGVSPEVFGVVENSNRSTIDAADFLIAKHVLTPRLEFQRETMQQRLVPMYPEVGAIIDYDSPIDSDKEFNYKVAKAAPWTLTTNEWRAMQNLDVMEGGDEERLAPSKMLPVDLLGQDLSEDDADDDGEEDKPNSDDEDS
jgi:phage portal protein BeeE